MTNLNNKNKHSHYFDPKPVSKDRLALPPFFMHIHIPKTGGTTFNTILEKNFGRYFSRFEGLWIHTCPKISISQVLKFMKLYPGIQASTSHMFSVILPYQQVNRRMIAIAFMRNPVDRFFSFYFHLRHFPGVDHPAKNYTLDKYIDLMCDTDKKPPASALHQMTGEDNQKGFNYIKNLIKNHHLYLLPTEYMDDGLFILQKDFPGYFKDITYRCENISKRDQEVTKAHRHKVRSLFSPYEWQVYELAHQFVNRNVQDL
jgi:hypothetical protein